MGQGACSAEGGCGNGRWLSKDDQQRYFSQFVDAPSAASNRGIDWQSQLEINLEERGATPSCCRLPFNVRDDELVSADSGKTMRTDLPSLLGLQQADDAVGCHEVCGAVCMTQGTGPPQVREGPGMLEVASRAPDGEVVAGQAAQPLAVPPEFAGLLYDWSAPSQNQVSLSPKDEERMRYCLRHFVRSLLVGVLLQLRLEPNEAPHLPAGQNIDARLSLSRDLSLLTISVGGVERSLPLKSVRWVRPPEVDAQDPAGLSWLLPGERGRTVVLRVAGGRFLRLQVEKKDQAAFLGTCLRLLVKASRGLDLTLSAAPSRSSAGWHVA